MNANNHLTLVIVRHGQSEANAGGLFTGIMDVPLTTQGEAEAIHAATLLNEAGLWPPYCFSSPLRRALHTADILAAHLHRSPSHIITDWRLAERNYGALTGRTKQSVVAEYGQEQFLAWRRSLDGTPPPMSTEQREQYRDAPEILGLTESLDDVVVRIRSVWANDIWPAIRKEGSALVVAHGNSLRALCSVIDSLTSEEVQALNIPNGQPLVYRLSEDGRPLVRGGEYLDPATAHKAAEKIAREGGT